MTQPGPTPNVGGPAADSAVDSTVDGFLNNALHSVEAHVPVPGGQMVDQMIQTEVDQAANNLISTEVDKGVGGILGDVEGLFGRHK